MTGLWIPLSVAQVVTCARDLFPGHKWMPRPQVQRQPLHALSHNFDETLQSSGRLPVSKQLLQGLARANQIIWRRRAAS